MAQITREEQHIREENCRLQKQLQIEIERREQLCQHLSESESSLDVELDFTLHHQQQQQQMDESAANKSADSSSFHGPSPNTVMTNISPHLMLNTMRPISPASPASGNFLEF